MIPKDNYAGLLRLWVDSYFPEGLRPHDLRMEESPEENPKVRLVLHRGGPSLSPWQGSWDLNGTTIGIANCCDKTELDAVRHAVRICDLMGLPLWVIKVVPDYYMSKRCFTSDDSETTDTKEKTDADETGHSDQE